MVSVLTLLRFPIQLQSLLSEWFIGWYPLVFRLALASSAVIFGVLIFALCIWIAACNKRGRGLAVFTGILNLISCFTMPGHVIRNSLINANVIEIPPYLLEGLAEAESIGVIGDHIEEILESIATQFYNEIVTGIPMMLFEAGALLVGFVTFLVTLIFFIRMLKLKPKALGVFAFLLFLVRTVLFPVKPGILSEIASGIYSVFHVVAFRLIAVYTSAEFLPTAVYFLRLWHNGIVASVDVFTANFSMTVLTFSFFLVAICALVTKGKQKKASKLASAVAIETEEAPAEEAPAEEAPAEEAPIEETPAEETPVLPEN